MKLNEHPFHPSRVLRRQRWDMGELIFVAINPGDHTEYYLRAAMKIARRRSYKQRYGKEARARYAACATLIGQHLYGNRMPGELANARDAIGKVEG